MKFGCVKCILMSVFMLVLMSEVFSQDYISSHIATNRLFISPSLVGGLNQPVISVGYRNEYTSLGSAFATYYASYEDNIPALKSGIGVSVIRDQQGSAGLSYSAFNVLYSYNLTDKRHIDISFGLKVGALLKTVNSNNLVFPDQVNGSQTNEFINKNKLNGDIGVGISGRYRRLMWGVSGDHLNQPSFGLSKYNKVKIKVTGYLATNISFQTGVYNRKRLHYIITPFISVTSQDGYNTMLYGVGYKRSLYYVGLFVRNDFAFEWVNVVGVAKLFYKKMAFAYSYDFGLKSNGGINLGGSHEFGVQYLFGGRESHRKNRAIKCPRF